MEGLPGWVISPMPGPPPGQHKHERQYTPNTHSVIPTRRIWNDDYDGEMIFGDLGGPKVSWRFSYGWGKTPKKPHPGNLSRPGIEPEPAAWQARMLPLAPQRWTSASVRVRFCAGSWILICILGLDVWPFFSVLCCVWRWSWHSDNHRFKEAHSSGLVLVYP